MAFCFKKKERVGKAVPRLYGERIDAALECLKQGTRNESTRNVRREIKKMRSILRLVRKEIGEGCYRRHSVALREASGRLTVWRDAHAALAALGQLSNRQFPEIKKQLQEKCLHEDRQLKRSTRRICRTLRKLKHRSQDLKMAAKGWALIGPGFKKSYRRGRRAFRIAVGHPVPETFHEWRKRIKDLWFQSRLLCPALSRRSRQAMDELKGLADHLGMDHDLVVLWDFAKQSGSDMAALDRFIRSKQRWLRSATLRGGRRFYAEKPSRFCSRLEKCWKRWRC